MTNTTDNNGNYTFSFLEPGTYVVGEKLKEGWLQTAPIGTYTIELSRGFVIKDQNFGNFHKG